MKKPQFTRKIRGAILGLLMLIGIGFALDTRAQAQSSRDVPTNAPDSDTVNAQAYRDRQLNRRFPREPRSEKELLARLDVIEAGVLVTNHSTRKIKSVSWVISFNDPETGALLATRDVTTKSSIAPGKAKVAKKTVSVPEVVRAHASYRNWVRARVSPTNSYRGQTMVVLPITTTKVASVTYADGATSTTP